MNMLIANVFSNAHIYVYIYIHYHFCTVDIYMYIYLCVYNIHMYECACLVTCPQPISATFWDNCKDTAAKAEVWTHTTLA